MDAIQITVMRLIKKDWFLLFVLNCEICVFYKQSLTVPTDPDYVWHKEPNSMVGYGDIWFFDLNYCDVNEYLLIFY